MIKYIKLNDFSGKLNENEILLMSSNEYLKDYRNSDALNGLPVAITPNGEEPKEMEEEEEQ